MLVFKRSSSSSSGATGFSHQQKPSRRNALLSTGGAAEEQLEERCMLATYYVATNGNNANNGKSTSKPFKTIQKAADVAKAGDKVLIRGGTYREQVQLRRSGSSGKPITFEGFKNEKVTISATKKVVSKPVIVNGNVSRFNLKSTFGTSVKDGATGSTFKNRQGLTVFSGGKLLREATRKNNIDLIRANTWTKLDSGGGNKLVDNDANFGKNLVGAMVRLRANNFGLVRARIKSVPNKRTLILDITSGPKEFKAGGPYLIFDKQRFVDSAGEWYFNEQENNLYVFGKPGNVEVKVREEGIVTNNHNFITIRKINFRAGDLKLGKSNNLNLDRISVFASNRNSGREVKGVLPTGLTISGNNNTIRNSRFQRLWGPAIRIPGKQNRVVNNVFQEIGLGGGNPGGVEFFPGSFNNLVSYNTFKVVGRQAIGGRPSQEVIEHNYFEKAALITQDTGAIYFWNTDVRGTTIRRNLFNDMKGAFVGGIYLDNQVKNAVIHNNIVWNSSYGIITNRPNENIRVYNNTIHASAPNSLFAGGPGAAAGPAIRGRIANNIYFKISGNLTRSPGGFKLQNNVRVTNNSPFVNFNKRDFRLKAGSSPINKGIVIKGVTDGFTGGKPDAGAIQFGQPMFVTGANLSKPPAENKLVFRWRKLP